MKIGIVLFLLQCFAHVGAEDEDTGIEVAAGSSVELNGEALLERMRLRQSLQHQDAAGTTSESFKPDLSAEGAPTRASRTESAQHGDGRAERTVAGGQSESVHSSAGERQADEEAAQQARLAAQAEAHKLAVEQQAKQRQAEAAQNKALAEAEAQAERGRAALERERENAAAEELIPAIKEAIAKARQAIDAGSELTDAHHRDLDHAIHLGSADAMAIKGSALLKADGVRADAAAAIAMLQRAADAGNPQAQRELGFAYANAMGGLPLDEAKAVLYLHFAAMGGDLPALLALGYRHMYGISVPKVCQTSVKYLSPVAEDVVRQVQAGSGPSFVERMRLADEGETQRRHEDEDLVQYYQYSADRGDVGAQVALGQLSFYGARGVVQNHAEAFKFFKGAAEKGDAAAMSNVGHMYAQGLGVAPNNETAVEWFRKGTALNNAAAQNGLGYMYMYGMGVAQNYEEAHSYFSKAAEAGNSEGRFNLGALYIGGYGVKKDYGKALLYFASAAKQGHLLALYNLAMMHLNGFGTPRSCQTAAKLLKAVAERGSWSAAIHDAYKRYTAGDEQGALVLYAQLAEQGFEIAQSNAAHIYDKWYRPRLPGYGVISGMSDSSQLQWRALRQYMRSAQQGNIESEIKVGDYHYYGWGTHVHHKKAVAHYRTAAESRDAQAYFNLAYMHENGLGVPEDFHMAKRYYDLSAESSAQAALPVTLALAKLKAKLWLLNILAQHFGKSYTWQEVHDVVEDHIARLDFETLLILLLMSLLAFILFLKQRRELPLQPPQRAH